MLSMKSTLQKYPLVRKRSVLVTFSHRCFRVIQQLIRRKLAGKKLTTKPNKKTELNYLKQTRLYFHLGKVFEQEIDYKTYIDVSIA